MTSCFATSRMPNPLSGLLRHAARSRCHPANPRRRPRFAQSSTTTAGMSSSAHCAQPLTLYYSDLYHHPLPPGHRFPMEKYELVRESLQRSSIMRNTKFVAAPLATRQELELVHCPDYVQRVLRGKLSTAEIRGIGFPWSLAGVRRSLGSTGGTVAAVREVLREWPRMRFAGHTAGGTHHAKRGGGDGFCVFNDLAVGARVALEEFGVGRVLVIDLDVHQGEGTAEIFMGDEDVYTVSLHAEGNYPFEKVNGNVDVGFEDGVRDEEYLEVVKRIVPMALEESNAELVLLQMGVDGLAQDSLGRLRLSGEGMSERNKMVYRMVVEAGLPGVVTMGGGYSKPEIEDSVRAHCDVYTDVVRVLDEVAEQERVVG